MLRLWWVLPALILGACSCGDDPPECVIDTDCPNIHERCGASGRCESFGMADTGPGRDSGRRDGGRVDGGRDGGPDSGPPDAGSPCDLRIGMYSVSAVIPGGPTGCGTTMAGYLLTTRRASAEMCVIELVSNDAATMPVMDGSAPVDDGGNFTATTLIVGGQMMTCMGVIQMSMITASCSNPSDGSTCTLVLNRSM